MANRRKRVLVIAFSNLRFDGRVSRQIDFIKDDYEVDVLALAPNEFKGYNFHELIPVKLTAIRKGVLAVLLLLRMFKIAYWVQYPFRSLALKLTDNNYDLVIANDIESVPLAFQIGEKVFFDSHEYAPRHFEERLWWRLFFQRFNIFLCEKYLPKLTGMSTVCDGLAQEYYKDFGIKPAVITNAPAAENVVINERSDEKVRLIHHGIANASRKMENMLSIMDHLGGDYQLDLMLVIPDATSQKSRTYIEQFKSEVERRDNVRLVPPVRSNEIVGAIKDYDIGLFLLEPINFNYTNALPNKLFEFIQARLVVAIGPSPEMSKIVSKYNCGIISKTFDPKDLADEIRSKSKSDLQQLKINSDIAAREVNAEVNKKQFLNLINTAIS